MSESLELLRGDDKIIVENTNGNRYVYTTEDGEDYKWDYESSEADTFPASHIKAKVEDEISGEVLDYLPLTFTVYSSSDKNTRELCRSAGLPTYDEELTDLLWNYPGEITITYELYRTEVGKLQVEAQEFEYGGTRYTPENESN